MLAIGIEWMFLIGPAVICVAALAIWGRYDVRRKDRLDAMTRLDALDRDEE